MPQGMGYGMQRSVFSLRRPEVEGSVDPNARPINPAERLAYRRDSAGNVTDIERDPGPGLDKTYGSAATLESAGSPHVTDNTTAAQERRERAQSIITRNSLAMMRDPTDETGLEVARSVGRVRGSDVATDLRLMEGESAPENRGTVGDEDPRMLNRQLLLMEARRRSRNPQAEGGVSGPADDAAMGAALRRAAEGGHGAIRQSTPGLDHVPDDAIARIQRSFLRRRDPIDSLAAPGGPERADFSLRRPDVEGSVDPNAVPLNRDQPVEIPSGQPEQIRRVDPNTPRTALNGTRTTPAAIERAGQASRHRPTDEDESYENAVVHQINQIEEADALDDTYHDEEVVDRVANDRIAAIRALNNPADPGPGLDLDPRAKMVQKLLAMEMKQQSQQQNASGSLGRPQSRLTGASYNELSRELDHDALNFPLEPEHAAAYLRGGDPLYRAGIRGRNPNEQDFGLVDDNLQTNNLRSGRLPSSAEKIAIAGPQHGIDADAIRTRFRSVGPIQRKADGRSTPDSLVRDIVGSPSPAPRDRTNTLLNQAKREGRDPLVLPIPETGDDLGHLKQFFGGLEDEDDFAPINVPAQAGQQPADDFEPIVVPEQEGFDPIDVQPRRDLAPITMSSQKRIQLAMAKRRLGRKVQKGDRFPPRQEFSVGMEEDLRPTVPGATQRGNKLSTQQADEILSLANSSDARARHAASGNRGKGRFADANVPSPELKPPQEGRTGGNVAQRADQLAGLGPGRRTINVNRSVGTSAPRIGPSRSTPRVVDLGDRADVVVPPGAGGQQRVTGGKSSNSVTPSLALQPPTTRGSAQDRGLLFRDVLKQELARRQQPSNSVTRQLPGPRGDAAIALNRRRQMVGAGPRRQQAATPVRGASLLGRRPGMKRLLGLQGVKSSKGFRKFEEDSPGAQMVADLAALIFTGDAA